MFQLLSIHSPFFVLCHKNFIKNIFSNAKSCIYVKKMGILKNMIRMSVPLFICLYPPFKLPYGFTITLNFSHWLKFYF